MEIVIILVLAGFCGYLLLGNMRAQADTERYHHRVKDCIRRGERVPWSIINVDNATFPEDRVEDEVAA